MTFIKTLGRAILANFLAICLLSFLFFSVVSLGLGLFLGEEEETERVALSPSDPNVLEITLGGRLKEKVRQRRTRYGIPVALRDVLLDEEQDRYGMIDYLLLIESAAKDERIQGISLKILSDFSANGLVTLGALRRALLAFRQSGKPLYCHLPQGVSEVNYYLASVADHITWRPPPL